MLIWFHIMTSVEFFFVQYTLLYSNNTERIHKGANNSTSVHTPWIPTLLESMLKTLLYRLLKQTSRKRFTTITADKSVFSMSMLVRLRLWLFLPEEEQQNEAQYREEKQGDILGRAPVPSTACRVGSQEGERAQKHGRVHRPERFLLIGAEQYHPREQQGDDGD